MLIVSKQLATHIAISKTVTYTVAGKQLATYIVTSKTTTNTAASNQQTILRLVNNKDVGWNTV